MIEFDYLVDWVKELCTPSEKTRFESDLAGDFLDEVETTIFTKIELQIGSHDGLDSGTPPNPQYVEFLDLCKKNPQHNPSKGIMKYPNDACLGHIVRMIMVVKYPTKYEKKDYPSRPVEKHNATSDQSENNLSKQGKVINEPNPITNILRDKFGDISGKFNN